MKMCKYSYSNGRCANIDIDSSFCIGEEKCSLSNILKAMNFNEPLEDNDWLAIPLKVWKIGNGKNED